MTQNRAKDWILKNLKDYVPLDQFSSFVFPVIGNQSPLALSATLLAVQPMEGPAGNVFYRDFVAQPRADDNNVINM